MWDAYRVFRMLMWLSGTLAAIGGVLAPAVAMWAGRTRDGLRASQPEWADDTPLWRLMLPGLPGWADPSLLAPLLLVAAAVFAVWLAFNLPMRAPRDVEWRDTRRAFTDSDREWIDTACQHRCENRFLFGLLRCRRRAEQLDHWWPWAKGGPTVRRNLVDLCAKCNRRKSARTPTRFATWMLYRARLRYFPPRLRGWCMPEARDAQAERMRELEGGGPHSVPASSRETAEQDPVEESPWLSTGLE